MTAVVNDVELRVYERGFCQNLSFDDRRPKFSSPTLNMYQATQKELESINANPPKQPAALSVTDIIAEPHECASD